MPPGAGLRKERISIRIMIKRFSLIAALLLLFNLSSMAQINRVRDFEYFPRNEVYVQYGTPSVVELSTILSSEYQSKGYKGDSRNHKFSGIVAFGYNFYVLPMLSFGIDADFGYGSADMYITDSDMHPIQDPIFVCRTTVKSYSAHLSASYTYWQQGPMECSGALYLGVTYKDESVVNGNTDYFVPEPVDRLHFSYHITAVKFRYGETFGGFAELGFGYRGLVNVGLSIKM